MDFIRVFKFLLEAFKREHIDFALIGGLALQSAGISRSTLDIDMLILATEGQKIKDIMRDQGYELIHESKDVLNFCHPAREFGRVDFLLAHRKYALAMLRRAEEKDIFSGQFKIRVLRVEDQIGLKVQSSSNDPRRRLQDMADIQGLIKEYYTQLDMKLLKEYFGLFDRVDELKQILNDIKDVD
jgi:predicted nucleotidyltransferase